MEKCHIHRHIFVNLGKANAQLRNIVLRFKEFCWSTVFLQKTTSHVGDKKWTVSKWQKHLKMLIPALNMEPGEKMTFGELLQMSLSTSSSSSSCCYRFLTYILSHKVHVWTWSSLILFKFRFFWEARHLFSIKTWLWSSYRCQLNKILGKPQKTWLGQFLKVRNTHQSPRPHEKPWKRLQKTLAGIKNWIMVITDIFLFSLVTIGCFQPGASSVVFVWEGYFLDISKPLCWLWTCHWDVCRTLNTCKASFLGIHLVLKS